MGMGRTLGEEADGAKSEMEGRTNASPLDAPNIERIMAAE
jgi:hypothetical protein